MATRLHDEAAIRTEAARGVEEEGLLKANPVHSDPSRRGSARGLAAPLAVALATCAVLAASVLAGLGLTAGRASAAFDELQLDPRLRAMGGAGTAAAADYLTLYHNPAALSLVEQFEGGVSYMNPHQESFLKLWSAGVSAKLPGKLGGIGFGFRRFGTDYLGQDLSAENTFSVAHGFSLYKDMSSTVAFGYALNLFNLRYGTSISGLEPGSANSFGVDLSARVTLHNRTAFGFLAQNINNPTIGDVDVTDLPRRLVGGVSYSPYPGVITNFDMESVLGERARMHGGVDFGLNDYLNLRFGIMTEPNVWSGGFGLNWKGVRLDYGFSTGAGPLQESHQVGLSVTPATFSSGDGEE